MSNKCTLGQDMSVIRILINRWELTLSLTLAFLAGTMLGLILLAVNKDRALKLGENLDKSRKSVVKIIFEILGKPHGAFKAVLCILS
ncbi:MAG: hypothetical protein AB1466_02815 [Actinomycetota bacterium]